MLPGVVALGIVCVVSLMSLSAPKQEMLDIENRKAASMPSFSLEAWISGDYQERFQNYVNDHVAFRQEWINLKCFADELLLLQTEEDGILLGKDGQMYTKEFVTADENERFYKNVSGLATFARTATVPVTVMIVPSPAAVLPEGLPAYAPMVSEDMLLDYIEEELQQSCTVLDMRDILAAHKDEYIYYRTDHHWTTLGAYYAYLDFCRSGGKAPCDPDWSQALQVEDFYGTHYAKTRYMLTRPDTITWFPTDSQMVVCKVTGDAVFEPQPQQPVIDAARFKEYDKYAAFLGGNNGYSVMTGQGEGKILVVKDSYANCFVPFLLNNYEQVGVVDYRNYAYGLSKLVEKEGYDEILILYSLQGFAGDTGLVSINRPAAD